ncbi:MAG: twin-arginine translocase subunit TatC [Candidatus Saccharimonadales bacterium]
MSSGTYQQTLLDHLVELRQRLFWVALTLVFASAAGYLILDQIIDVLMSPLATDQPLIYTSPAGGLEFLFKICLFFGFLLTIPVLLYHIIKFIEPMIFKQSVRSLITLISVSIILMVLGASFAYFVSLPAALHFLTGFNTDQLQALLSTNEYLSFVMIYVAGFALIFQLPLLMIFINRINPLQPQKLWSTMRYVIVISFIVAAIITPTPDPMNQALMAGPIIIMYIIGVGAVWLINRSKAVSVTDPDIDPSYFDNLTETASELRPETPVIGPSLCGANSTSVIDYSQANAELRTETSNLLDLTSRPRAKLQAAETVVDLPLVVPGAPLAPHIADSDSGPTVKPPLRPRIGSSHVLDPRS